MDIVCFPLSALIITTIVLFIIGSFHLSFSSSYRQNTLSWVSKKHKQECFGSTCVNFASLSAGTSALCEQMLILKLAHNWMIILQMENSGSEFHNKAFFLLENVNLSKAKSWEYIHSIFTFLLKISQVRDVFFHCSKALEQKIGCWKASGEKLDPMLRKQNCPWASSSQQAATQWGFSSASSRVTLQTEQAY